MEVCCLLFNIQPVKHLDEQCEPWQLQPVLCSVSKEKRLTTPVKMQECGRSTTACALTIGSQRVPQKEEEEEETWKSVSVCVCVCVCVCVGVFVSLCLYAYVRVCCPGSTILAVGSLPTFKAAITWQGRLGAISSHERRVRAG